MSFPAVIPVKPVIDSRVRALCAKPYHGHSKGCPNFNDPKHSHRCPPAVCMFYDRYDPAQPVFTVFNEFNLAEHMARLAQKPRKGGKPWTDAELRCVLYWQPKARKQLQEKIDQVLQCGLFPGYEATMCPEGMGVNVTQTLADVGVHLEWPPRVTVRQVALLAVPRLNP